MAAGGGLLDAGPPYSVNKLVHAGGGNILFRHACGQRSISYLAVAKKAGQPISHPLVALIIFTSETNPVLDVTETALPDVKLLKPRRFSDPRGFFSETWNAARMAEHGFDIAFAQDNLSLSVPEGTIRGLHYQAPPHGQGKLVSCVKGAIHDVAVDVRQGSPTYGESVMVELSFENGCQLWIPEGFLHGFITRAPDTLVAYKCTRAYAPESDGGVRWDSCDIDWGLTGEPLLSEKDEKAPALKDWQSPFIYQVATR